MPARGPARQSGSSSPKEVSPGRRRPGQMMRAPVLWPRRPPVSQHQWRQLGRRPGYSGDVPDGPLIFCTCAGICDQGSRRTASGRRIRPL